MAKTPATAKQVERRRESRYDVKAETVVELHGARNVVDAKTENLSAGGVFLRFKEPVALKPGDMVSCEFKVEHDDASPLPSWGVGRVTRTDGSCAAVELTAAGFEAPVTPTPKRRPHA